MLNPFSWSLDGWFFALQVLSFVILGFTVAVGYLVSRKQAREILDLGTKLAEAKTKQAEAEGALLKLQKRIDWRSFDGAKFREVLTRSAKGTAQIVYKKEDEESYNFASGIVRSLRATKWNAEILPSKDDPESTVPFTLREGIGFSVDTSVSLVVGSDLEFQTRGDDRRNPLAALIKAFEAAGHSPAIVGSKPRLNLPKGTVRIVVGGRL